MTDKVLVESVYGTVMLLVDTDQIYTSVELEPWQAERLAVKLLNSAKSAKAQKEQQKKMAELFGEAR